MARRKSIKNLVNVYGSGKILLKLPKSGFKVGKTPTIKIPKGPKKT